MQHRPFRGRHARPSSRTAEALRGTARVSAFRHVGHLKFSVRVGGHGLRQQTGKNDLRAGQRTMLRIVHDTPQSPRVGSESGQNKQTKTKTSYGSPISVNELLKGI